MRLTHFGHACLLVETGGVRILIDPGSFSHGFEELTGLDAVLITHRHGDHVDVERLPALLEANDGALLAAEPETAAELSGAGIQTRPLHPDEETQVGEVQVSAQGGQHAVIHPDIPRVGNVGFLLTAPDEPTLFHPGDAYTAVPSDVDVLAVPLSAPWAALKETVEFVRAVRPGTVVPIHDALLTPGARGLYLGHVERLSPEGTQVLDLAGAGPTEP